GEKSRPGSIHRFEFGEYIGRAGVLSANRHAEIDQGHTTGLHHSTERPSQRRSPPNVLIAGPVPVSPGFPIKAFGNDGLKEKLRLILLSSNDLMLIRLFQKITIGCVYP